MKQFKAESKRVLDMMINSIYTNKEIFLRELVSNCSDAMDKLYYKGMSEGITGLNRNDMEITVNADKDARTITITDMGIGMTAEELEKNLGVIAQSDSFAFKKGDIKDEDISIIGQFGVGFYSAFMVSNKVEVLSRAYGMEEANLWTSTGVEGYDITPATKESYGTTITLHIKPNTEQDNYDEFLDNDNLCGLIKKYSDYIKYPIKMKVHTSTLNDEGKRETHESIETVNSMVPLWKKQKSEITKEEYDAFYRNEFNEAENLAHMHLVIEGTVDYKALLFIPKNVPYNYYSKDYVKGLKLYTNGVLITDKCGDLLPDYFGFVKGIVDTDLPLNISRETIQQNRQLKTIAKNIEKKIKDELTTLLNENRDTYVEFFKNFGMQIKYGIYNNWGMDKDKLQDLLIYHSVKQDKMITLDEYIASMPEGQKYIYYATGRSINTIKHLPQCEAILDAGYDVLCMTDDIDEFAVRFLMNYKDKDLKSVSDQDNGIESSTDTPNDKDTELTNFLTAYLNEKVNKVKISSRLKTHPVCLTTEGNISIEMEKILNMMPKQGDNIKAVKVLEINSNHPIYNKLHTLYTTDTEKLKEVADVLYAQAQIIEGLEVENPSKLADLVCRLLADEK